jgi:hypothetical protein
MGLQATEQPPQRKGFSPGPSPLYLDSATPELHLRPHKPENPQPKPPPTETEASLKGTASAVP